MARHALVDMKTCNRCGETKQLDDFYNKGSNKTGKEGVCKVCRKIQKAENKQKQPDKIALQKRRGSLRLKYGITVQDYDTMLVSQGYCCAICNSTEAKISLAVDHCHTTGKIRGLLCNKCNRGLGLFNDNPTLITNAVKYLQQNGN